jgi:hypothetical protein
MVQVAVTVGSSKHQAQPPTYQFEKLLEETCPNHAYPIKHKLKYCVMMKNFMAIGSLTQGMEVDEVPDDGGVTPFPGEDVIMTIYNRNPSLGVRHVPDPSAGTSTRCGWGIGTRGCKVICFPISVYINVCRNMDMYITTTPNASRRDSLGS